jgi:recombination protein RecR
MLPIVIQDLIEEFARLPSIGKKSAQRLVLHLVKQPSYVVDRFSKSLLSLSDRLGTCKECFGWTDGVSLCSICDNEKRNKNSICIVSEMTDVEIIESTGYNGVYHILHGLISPQHAIGPQELHLDTLKNRIVSENTEVIVALNSTFEGETTLLYIRELLKDVPCRITRLGMGIPTGGLIEWMDKNTLEKSFETRQDI